jgi:hypothetical protein
MAGLDVADHRAFALRDHPGGVARLLAARKSVRARGQRSAARVHRFGPRHQPLRDRRGVGAPEISVLHGNRTTGPEPDVRAQCVQVGHNRLSEAEAAMYQADIDFGMKVHPRRPRSGSAHGPAAAWFLFNASTSANLSIESGSTSVSTAGGSPIAIDEHGFELRLELPSSGEVTLAWTCPHFAAVGDPARPRLRPSWATRRRVTLRWSRSSPGRPPKPPKIPCAASACGSCRWRCAAAPQRSGPGGGI